MNRLLKTIIAMAMLVALDAQAQCQMLRNFPTVLTGGGTQNWNLMQSADGLLYLANSHGLMIHDGYRWSVTLGGQGLIEVEGLLEELHGSEAVGGVE